MTASSVLWLLVVAAGPVVRVDGDAVCPTPQDVSERIAALLPPSETNAASDIVRIEDGGDVVRLTLLRPDGALLGVRTLPRRSSCADLAAAAAVVVAAWESDVHPEFRPPPLRPSPAGSAVDRDPVAVAIAPPRPPAPGIVFDVGAALSGSLAPGSGSLGTAAGGLVVASGKPRGRRLGARLAVAAGGERELPLGAGAVRWRRLVAAVGPELRFVHPSVALALDIHVDLLVSALSARGEGFTTNRSSDGIDPGVGAGTRLLLGRYAVVPWLDFSVGGWFREAQAVAMPAGTSVALPRVEATLALGLSVLLGR